MYHGSSGAVFCCDYRAGSDVQTAAGAGTAGAEGGDRQGQGCSGYGGYDSLQNGIKSG